MIDIDGFKEYLYNEELASNTIRSYVKGVELFSRMFDEISKPNLIMYKKQLAENFKPHTVNLRIAAMLCYCRFKDIPMKLKSVKEPKKTHIDNVISEEQYMRLTNGLKCDKNERWYVNVVLLAKIGMRISEALKITKKDLIAGNVTINTKSHMRTIYFPKSLVDDIKYWLDELSDNDVVMQNRLGEPISAGGVRVNLKNFAKKYGIPKEVMHPHTFRHFFAIEFLKRNNNIALLADVLGHSSVNVTQLYLRQSQEQQSNAVDKAVNW